VKNELMQIPVYLKGSNNDADDFISYAVNGAKRMQQLINDLLAYPRVRRKEKPFELINSKTIIEQVLVNLSRVIKESKAVITYDSLPDVKGDSLQLMQLFQNLIDNAIKFRGKKSPRIHISAEQKGKEWVFSMRDNGIGICSKFLERIFIIFQRLHTREEYPGTGIGLALCKKIVEGHGGCIWIESEIGKGSVFYFTIPAEGNK
jgi:chemotaxis family two-component system sensor kinase Cph1